MTAGKVLGDLFTFLFLVYFARIFGIDILGKYAFAMSFGGLFTIFINMGLNIVMVRDLSQDRHLSAKYMANLLVTQGVLAILIWLLIGYFVFAQKFSYDTKIIIIFMATYHVFYNLTMLVKSEFNAHEEMQYSAFLEIFHKVIILLLGVAAILIWRNSVITLAVYPLSAFSMFLLGFWISVSRYGRPSSKIEYSFIKNIFKKAIPFLGIIVLMEFYVRIGIILLTYFHGERAAGIYAAADRLLFTIATGAHMLGHAILPTMSRLSAHSKDEFLILFKRAIRLIILVSLPMSTLLFISSRPIILIIYGDQFRESITVLSILSWSVPFFAVNLVLRAFLIVNHQPKIWIKVAGITYLVYSLVCIIVIPWYNYLGLAYARLITEIVLFAIIFFYINISNNKIPIIEICRAPVISCLISVLVFYLMAEINLWLKISCSMIVFIMVMFLLKGIKINDLLFAKDLLFSNISDTEEGRISS